LFERFRWEVEKRAGILFFSFEGEKSLKKELSRSGDARRKPSQESTRRRRRRRRRRW